MTKSGSAGVSLNTRTLRVEGSVVVDGTGGMDVNGGTIETVAGATFDLKSDADLNATAGGSAERFLNAGTLIKSGGTADSVVAVEWSTRVP